MTCNTDDIPIECPVGYICHSHESSEGAMIYLKEFRHLFNLHIFGVGFQVSRHEKQTTFYCSWDDGVVGCEVESDSATHATRICASDTDGCRPTSDAPNAKEEWYECKY